MLSKISFLGFCLLFWVSQAIPLCAAPNTPNIILVFADDLGYGDIAPFGSKLNRTPNLDRMAEQGMKLTSFYAAPVCTPSRAQVLTGCYAKRVSLPDVIFPAANVGLNPAEHTVAELLKHRGYATMCIGKWHVGDHREFLPTRHGFDRYFGLPYSNDMGGREGARVTGNKDRRPPLPLLRDDQVIETISPSAQDGLTARYTEEAVKFIREHKEGPFFLYFPHTAVHVPLHPGRNFQGRSRNGSYGDWVEELDRSVGALLDTLRELKLEDKTLLIFSSDNGPWLTQGTNGGVAGPLRGGKGGTFEGGTRVPTIAWWPGHVPAKSVCDAVAGNIDFLPTFVSLAGGSLPTDRKIDGRDISPLLLGQTRESPRAAHYYFSGNSLQAVRSGPWKLAIARQSENMNAAPLRTNTAAPFKPTLYNLNNDIGERNDLASQHPDIVERLQSFVAVMDADLGISKSGPGVREPGRVQKPTGLWLAGHAPDVAAAPPALDSLKPGDILNSDEAPEINGKPLLISCEVDPKSSNGVIVAQGGSTFGYALYLKDGKLKFTVREAGKPLSITASETLTTAFNLQARLARDGAMSLTINNRKVAEGKFSGLISRQPMEDFCVGHDNRMPVGDYVAPARFTGNISNLTISTD